MKEKITINEFVSEEFLQSYFNRLYKICRSILGRGFRESLDIIGEIVKLNKKKIPSGTKVLDWTVPDEWNIRGGYIITPSGKKIADFKTHSLHIVNYSIPINKKVDLKELKKHLHSMPSMPDAIPYVCSYYNRTWGFCISHNQSLNLEKGEYKVYIDSDIKPGHLVYSDTLIPGKSKKEILLSTYLCHPQMANHELSGPLVWSILYKILKNTGPHKFSYRFLICPENIGSAAFLHYSRKKIKNIVAGYVINFAGYGKEITYKKSRIGNSLSDLAAENVLKHSGFPVRIIDFFPDGSDERQFCSPGFNMPIGLIMRKTLNTSVIGSTNLPSEHVFQEYHTSLDGPDKISFKTLIETIKIYYDVLLTIENNFVPLGKVQYGTPQLSKSPINLYRNIMDFNINAKLEQTRILLEILNLADGSEDLLTIAAKKNFSLIKNLDLINKLLKTKYIKKK